MNLVGGGGCSSAHNIEKYDLSQIYQTLDSGNVEAVHTISNDHLDYAHNNSRKSGERCLSTYKYLHI